jgi:hypothetical protein
MKRGRPVRASDRLGHKAEESSEAKLSCAVADWDSAEPGAGLALFFSPPPPIPQPQNPADGVWRENQPAFYIVVPETSELIPDAQHPECLQCTINGSVQDLNAREVFSLAKQERHGFRLDG